jgi:hypothetical protein
MRFFILDVIETEIIMFSLLCWDFILIFWNKFFSNQMAVVLYDDQEIIFPTLVEAWMQLTSSDLWGLKGSEAHPCVLIYQGEERWNTVFINRGVPLSFYDFQKMLGLYERQALEAPRDDWISSCLIEKREGGDDEWIAKQLCIISNQLDDDCSDELLRRVGKMMQSSYVFGQNQSDDQRVL